MNSPASNLSAFRVRVQDLVGCHRLVNVRQSAMFDRGRVFSRLRNKKSSLPRISSSFRSARGAFSCLALLHPRLTPLEASQYFIVRVCTRLGIRHFWHMSSGQDEKADDVATDGEADARLDALEGKFRDLDEKTRIQECESLETKRRLAEAVRAAEQQKSELEDMLAAEMVNMLADRTGDGAKEKKEEITPNKANGDEQPPAASAESKET